MNRRGFLAAMAAAALAADARAPARAATRPLAGGLLAPAHAIGHALRDGGIPEPTETLRRDVLIAGGGIAGLSAAWKLRKAGLGDFTLVELEDRVGGNARWGENAVSAYPWGAHYLPPPTRESRAVRELLADFGVLQGDPHAATPRYDERHLCHTPQDRLYRNGIWQEGLLPQIGATKSDLAQYRQFEDIIHRFKVSRDAEGRRAFAIPMALSSPHPRWTGLDRVTLRDWLLAQGLDSAPLHWYADYACRDDFGLGADATSAWAGLHYFAARDGAAADAEEGTMLTWPEGNGWLVKRLEALLAGRILQGALVYRVDSGKAGVVADVYLPRQARSVRIACKHLIWSCPVFQLPRVLARPDAALAKAAAGVEYSSWMVANLSLDEAPRHTIGAPLAWDNVLYDSAALGYVVATHQDLRLRPQGTVLTYYLPLARERPAEARRRLLDTAWETWAELALGDLARAHADIRELTSRIDVFRWGHAMARPLPGTLRGAARGELCKPRARLHLAHSDLSGFSTFEEAQYRGIAAAERVLKALGVRFASSIR